MNSKNTRKLITNIGALLQVEQNVWVEGKDLDVVPHIYDAYLLIEGEFIKDYGSISSCPREYDELIDAKGGWVLPTFCDSHTHIVFAGSRENEYVQRILGASYEEIAAKGGGILNSAKWLQQASEEELLLGAFARAQEVISYGTGAIEIKSGYGLTVESELKMLRVIQRLKSLLPIPVKATFLGAHAIPIEYQTDRAGYISLIINEMLPRVAEERLADYCDVFCDKGFFTPQETELILEAAWKYGLKPKIHANELDFSGGVQVGVKMQALSVDHLECSGQEEIDILKGSSTIPVFLPGTSFFLNIPYAPAKKFQEAGLGFALASDYNPGSSPSGNMKFIQTLACLYMHITPEAALNATTINGAYAMEVASELGSISRGKMANLILTKPIPSLAYMSYAYTQNIIMHVFLKGEIFVPQAVG
ncbi:MAG: imidazolonepropionase [Bacteroidia bacterium]|nr:imidazolonepropionase [Bacteroidia bacterium]MDW8159167.1 imidazolonepropionase [Bacteroidia bacterium]